MRIYRELLENILKFNILIMGRTEITTNWNKGRLYDGNKLWSSTIQPWLSSFQPWQYKGTEIDTTWAGRTKPTTSWN